VVHGNYLTYSHRIQGRGRFSRPPPRGLSWSTRAKTREVTCDYAIRLDSLIVQS